MKSICIIILAAGESSRMGQSKQLLTIDDETLLHRAVKTALDTEADSVLVVLGFDHEKHKHALQDQPVEYVVNPQWQKGIGSSIKAGLDRLLQLKPLTEGVIIMVCDQPFLTTTHLSQLISIFQKEKKNVVTSTYDGVEGTPTLFNRSLFDDIYKLADNEGAKKIISQSKSKSHVEFKNGSIDLDTPEEYTNFLLHYKNLNA